RAALLLRRQLPETILERDPDCELSRPRDTSGRSRLAEQRVAVDRVPIEASVVIQVEYFGHPRQLDRADAHVLGDAQIQRLPWILTERVTRNYREVGEHAACAIDLTKRIGRRGDRRIVAGCVMERSCEQQTPAHVPDTV